MQKRIPEKARDLRRFIEAYRYSDWIEHMTRDFDYPNLIKGLQWFTNSACRGCGAGGGMPSCEVRECCRKKGYENCYSCGDFSSCRKLGYQKETYKIDHEYQQIRKIGYEKWRKMQEEKARVGFDNIVLLERKRPR